MLISVERMDIASKANVYDALTDAISAQLH